MFQSNPFFRNPNSRASSPLCRRSLTQISPAISPFTSPSSTPCTLSPRDECKAFIMPNIYAVTPRDETKSFIIPPNLSNLSPFEEKSFFLPSSCSPKISSSLSPRDDSKFFATNNQLLQKSSLIENRKSHGNTSEKSKTGKNKILHRSFSMSVEGLRHAFAHFALPQLLPLK